MAMVKALIPGMLLTWIVSGLFGTNGSKGGFLAVQYLDLNGNAAFTGSQHGLYWSWPLFSASTLLAFALFKMLD